MGVLGTVLGLGIGVHIVKNVVKETKKFKDDDLKKLIKEMERETKI